MDQQELNEILRRHKIWLETEGVDGARADLRGADLRWADLRGASLEGAVLDFSAWPLGCGSRNVKIDRRIAAQLAYHFCAVECDDPDYLTARAALLPLANTFHRVESGELNPLEEVPTNE